MSKQDEGAKKAAAVKSAYDALVPLVGLDIKKMSNNQQLVLLTVMGQLLSILDENGKVRPL